MFGAFLLGHENFPVQMLAKVSFPPFLCADQATRSSQVKQRNKGAVMRRFADKKDREKKLLADKRVKKGEKLHQRPKEATKATLKREKEVRLAVANSLKSASAISMDRKEEDRLLDLIAMLENVVIDKPRVHFGKQDEIKSCTVAQNNIDGNEKKLETNSEEAGEDDVEADDADATSESCSDDHGNSPATAAACSGSERNDDSSESSSEEESSNCAATAPLTSTCDVSQACQPVVVGRQKFIRKIIRDERRLLREQQAAHKLQPSAERVVARLRHSLKSTPATLPSTSSAGTPITGTASMGMKSSASTVMSTARAESALAHYASPDETTRKQKSGTSNNSSNNSDNKPSTAQKVGGAQGSPVGTSVRVNAHFDKSGDGVKRPGAAKLMVLERAISLPELLATLRMKFNATATTSGAKGGSSSSEKVPRYDAARVFSSGRVLTSSTWAALVDGESLTLFSGAQDAEYSAAAITTAVAVAAESALHTTELVESAENPVSEKAAVAKEQIMVGDEESQQACDVSDPTSTLCKAVPPVPQYWTPPSHNLDRYLQSHPATLSGEPADPESARLSNEAARAELGAALAQPTHAHMQQQRRGLPIYHKRADLLAQIAHHQVVVVSGETGSGKTTQLPQYLLEELVLGGRAGECNIVCTQPRRIAAVSVAERVHKECNQPGNQLTALTALYSSSITY